MTHEELILKTKEAVRNERTATAEVVRLFREISDRKIFLARGYSSMFAMATELFGYCAASAQLRINAMRLINDVPDVEAKIESGEMSLTVAANIQTFLYNEKREERPYSQNAKIELIETCMNKSVREVQKEFVRRNPEIEKREVVTQVSEDRVRVSSSHSSALEEKLQRIKEIWSHVDPNMSREQLLERMAEIVLDKIDPIRKASRLKEHKVTSPVHVKTTHERINPLHAHEGPASESETSADTNFETNFETNPKHIARETSQAREALNESLDAPAAETFLLDEKRTRYIDARTKREVIAANDGGGCEFVHFESSRRCGSQFQLQVDHIQPFSQGGLNERANLRILCAQHNRWRSERR